MRVGLNLSRVDAFSTASPFNDAMLLHGPWRAVKPGTQTTHPDPLEYVNDWPVPKADQWALCRVFPACDGRHPIAQGGMALVEWDGDGEVMCDDPYVGVMVAATADSKTIALAGADTKGIPIVITRSSSSDPVQNVRLWLPGCRRSEKFNRQYVAAVKPFSALRFMDWQLTNNNPPITTPGYSQIENGVLSIDKGVLTDDCVEMANAAGAASWLCIGHQWSDATIKMEANWAHVAADGEVLVEFSNELWNAAFPQNAWLQAHTISAVPPKKYEVFLAEQMARVFGIWRQEGHCTRVVSDQIGRGLGSRLDRLCALLGPNGFDAVATAAYFRPTSLQEAGYTVATSIDTVLAHCLEDIQGRVTSGINAVAAVARKYGKPLYLYEGGQHLRGNNKPYQQVYLAAQDNPDMGACYRALLDACRAAGAELFMHYAGPWDKWSSSGSWSFAEYYDEPIESSPKHKELVRAP